MKTLFYKGIKAKVIFIILLLVGENISCQNIEKQYNNIVYKLEADLNKDNLKDIVQVTENNLNKKNPYLLEIKFRKNDDTFQTVLSSTKAVMEKFPYGDERKEAILESLEIKNGILIFRNQLIRGSLVHKFRYQKGNFELIGFTMGNASPGYIKFVDYNLSTGTKIVKHSAYETDKILMYKKTTEKLTELPKLQDFEPYNFVY